MQSIIRAKQGSNQVHFSGGSGQRWQTRSLELVAYKLITV